MKVQEKYYLNAEMYIRRVNHCPLEKLDLSEFFDGDLKEAKEKFMFTGLSNTDFIKSDWVDKHYPNIKRKIVVFSPLR